MKSYNKKISCLLGLVGFVLALALDQVTKYLAVMDLRKNGPVILIKNVFQLQYLENRGAAFGIMQNRQFFFFYIIGLFQVHDLNPSHDFRFLSQAFR